MSKVKNLSEALVEFKERYPNATTSDVEIYIYGFSMGAEIYNSPVNTESTGSIDTVENWNTNDYFTPPNIA